MWSPPRESARHELADDVTAVVGPASRCRPAKRPPTRRRLGHHRCTLVLQHHLAGLRSDRALRRVLPDRQHLLDADLPAHPRARTAASGWRDPRSGDALRAAESMVVGLGGSVLGMRHGHRCHAAAPMVLRQHRHRPRQHTARARAAHFRHRASLSESLSRWSRHGSQLAAHRRSRRWPPFATMPPSPPSR